MAVPMRKKREWSTPEDNADSLETAAFEATVAAAKDMAAETGVFLSDAKSDLTEHQRWLHDQSAAVERDRRRHERWLKRQRDRRLAMARKGRLRSRHRLMRRQALLAVQGAVLAGLHYIGSVIAFVISKLVEGVTSVGALIGRGFSWVGARIFGALRAVARGVQGIFEKVGLLGRRSGAAIAAGASWGGTKASDAAQATGGAVAERTAVAISKARESARASGSTIAHRSSQMASRLGAGVRASVSAIAAGSSFASSTVREGARASASAIAQLSSQMASKLGAGVRASASAIAVGSSFASSKVRRGARAGGSVVAAGSSLAASRIGVAAQAVTHSLGRVSSSAVTKSMTVADATGHAASRQLAQVSHKTAVLRDASKRRLGSAYRVTKARVGAIGPALYVWIARAGRRAERYALSRAPQRESSFGLKEPAIVYGPHEENAVVDGRPANEPYVPEVDVPVLPESPAHSDETGRPPQILPVSGTAPGDTACETPSGTLRVPQGAEGYGPVVRDRLSYGFTNSKTALLSALAKARAVAKEALSWSANALSSFASRVRARAGAMGARAGEVSHDGIALARVQTERAQSWLGEQAPVQTAQRWAQRKGLDLSQMMIIAGTVLLVCGALLLGGGLLARGGGATVAAGREDTFTDVGWAFEESALPLPDRAVFTLSGTPASFLINGLSVSGANLSDQSLTNVEAVLRPDVQRPDLNLSLEVEALAAEDADGRTQVLKTSSENTIPASADFRLVFPFPDEALGGADGISVEEFFDSYGGLLLEFRYAVDGVQKSLIQYLTPDVLRAQLEEVSAGAEDS